MKVTLTAAVLFLGLASALPAEDLIELDDRAEPSNAPIDWDGPNQSASIKCGKNTYDGHDVYLAAQHGVNLGLLSPPETRGEKKFPHAFDHDDSKGVKLHFPKHCPENDKNRQEYPLVKNGPYNGGKNNKKYGDERVVFYYDGKAQGVDGHPLVYYCGLMTHDGAAKGGFIQCPDGK
ncbi:ribonuclease domain-containing protein [Purpureocillium lilacinum]|uniref:ribonuclease T1 n=1 Tax=Purpureocillium lilacinum TaxID=33203 RepID=A0A179GZB0_PURLI|nr:ribonuclease domain-containing protein [Purpureocillium lilacinum]KAK4084784.1 hypothetical protein Purlil1_10190 [Purpureocillium lilacinum]OAQ74475.1 ribonuclease domain-containing protein [Purpureocillium lilacinum]OAQ82581.1 ribonuclease domain-containing protein [Purpureocillium lilacinum]PWI72265.1 hypothetical protein PCL_10888 [Purpureocillium lilacinum]GJN71073.1 hypothetical protein PLICBS_005135 [Purpureocillium lilacinum]